MQYNVENSDYAVEFTAVNMDVAVTGQAEIEVAVGDAARIDVGEALNYIKTGTAEIEAVAQEKTDAFNLNAEQKTDAFNDNAADKTSEYNHNATVKTTDYNDNATDKLNAFNENATSKTGDFNTNATNKTNAFNQNASDKTDAFDLNATNKTTDFNDNYTDKKSLIDAEVANAEASATAAAGSANTAKQWAIGDPSEPSGNSAKYWAEEAATTLANKQDLLVSGTNIKTINNESLLGSGNISISGGASYTAGTGIDITSDVISVDSTVVTTNTDQNITGIKTFVGEKRIKFKQSASGNKLGFTLYDNNNKEAAAFEYKPNVINGYPLMYLGQYIGSSSVSYVRTPIYVGFRSYDWDNTASYNLVAPLAKDAKASFSLNGVYKTFYLPLGVTDGNTTVTTASTGLLDISSILPTVNDSTVTITQGGVTKGTFTTNQSGNSTIALDAGGSSYSAGTGIDITNDTISVDSTVASGAAAGATAVQPADLAATLAAIYPVGSIYIGTQSTCPLATLISGSTWELVATNKALWGGNGSNANTMIAAGLPNVTDEFVNHWRDWSNEYAITPSGGAFYDKGNNTIKTSYPNIDGINTGSYAGDNVVGFDLSRANSIYGNSNTVQPPAYVVNVWRRTA
jgi:hypothetical protein